MTAKSKYRAVVRGVLASGLFLIGASTTVAASTGVLETGATVSPSDVVWNTIGGVFGEVASIGSAILFVYGFFHLIKLGTDSGDTSGSVKRLGVSWGLGIAIQSWQVFQSFVRNQGTSTVPEDAGSAIQVAEPTFAPLIADQATNAFLAIGYVPF